jgi:hypothetical protein
MFTFPPSTLTVYVYMLPYRLASVMNSFSIPIIPGAGQAVKPDLKKT